MPVKGKIEYAKIGDLFLDPLNPRLGRHFTEGKPSQEMILERMKLYSLEELAVSFVDNGFWPQEPLIVVNEKLQGARSTTPKLIVVEGNRRLATVKLLLAAASGKETTKKWRAFANEGEESIEQLKTLPYMIAETREQVNAYLGFRHVTGIKEWSPGEKAEFIEKLVDSGKSYHEVMRMIGSNTEAVRRNYIAFKLVRQMEDAEEGISTEDIEDRFSILALALRSSKVLKFLGVNGKAEPEEARSPASKETLDNLKDFAIWTFGDRERGIEPVLPESRDIEALGTILDSPQAVSYMRTSERPSFDFAYRIAGGNVGELLKTVLGAGYEIQKALSTIHHHKDEPDVINAVERLARDFKQLLISFPESRKKHFPGADDVKSA